MENKSHAIAAGAFVLALAALLVGLAVWLMRDTSEQRVYEIASRDGVTGLQPQAGVRYKGVLVGRVTAIELDAQSAGSVLVRIAVNDRAPITTSTFATLGFQGVTGLAFVQLDDAGESTQPLATSKTQVARIPMRPGMVSRFTAQGGLLLDQLEQASGRANALLAAENQKALMAAITNLGQAAASIHQLSQRADQMLATRPGDEAMNLPRVVAQAEATLQSVKATSERLVDTAEAVKTSATEFKQLSARMNGPGGTLDRIAQSTEALTATGQLMNATLVPRLNRTADDTARTARQLGRVADTVSESPQSLILGKGAAQPGPGESGFVVPPRR
ncbi:MAG: MCE family protein [Burkholderiales bacterium]|nr:MCE family protein [Burkholderiales bacterium]